MVANPEKIGDGISRAVLCCGFSVGPTFGMALEGGRSCRPIHKVDAAFKQLKRHTEVPA